MKLFPLVLLAAAGAVSCSLPPIYLPGGLAARAAAEPAPAMDGEYVRFPDGTRLFVFQAGDGAPAIVVPGGPGVPPAGPWPGLAPYEGNFQFTYFHQRGSGLSDRPVDRLPQLPFPELAALLDRRLGMARQILDIEAIRSSLGAEKIVLIGHSFGGFLASLYAAEFPSRMEKLLLLAPADVLRLPAADGGLYGRIGRLLKGSGLEGSYSQWMGRQFDYGSLFRKSEEEVAALNSELYPHWNVAQESLHPAWGWEAEAAGGIGGWIQPACFISMGSAHDYAEALGRITAPTTVVQGDADAAGITCGRTYAQAIPGARLVVAEGAGHFPHLDPEHFPGLVREFFQE